MTEQDTQKIRAAIADCLSGLDTLPSQRAEILRAAKGETKMKRKMHLGLILALILALLTTGIAVADALGLFGQLGQQKHADARLTGLEHVSIEVNKVITTGEGVTITIGQAYYDGQRVFISYRMEGPYDMLETGTGDPGIASYDWENPGELFREVFFVDGPNGQVIRDWLDGSEPRWAKRTSVNVHDGLQIGETYLDIIGGEYYFLEDGTMMSWKECEVPAELAADEVSFSIGVFTNCTTYYQTPEGLYVDFGDRTEAVWHDFTLQKTEYSAALTGTAQTAEWSAVANLTASAIDVKGEVILECPKAWSDLWQRWENPEGIDYIHDWAFYVDGKKVDGHNLNGGVNVLADGRLSFGIGFRLDDLTAEMKLAPVYAKDGVKLDEAIVLTLR